VKAGQLVIAVLAAAAVGVALLLAKGGGDSGSGGGSAQKAPAGAISVSFAYSPEKEPLLLPLIKKFNEQQHKIGGKPVFIEGANVSSGEAETKIAKGKLQPVAWSPASSLWGRLLDFEADQPYAPRDAPSIVRTPLVVAMWEPMAKALGWPKKQLGFSDILDLARSKAGWSAYGHPEWGPFRLVHTNPDFSTSGLSAIVAEYYAATGKLEGLTEADVTSSKARAIVRGIERSIVHYGDTTLFISDQMRAHGPGYASAVAMEEVTLLDFNRNRGSQPPLVAIYPKEGTFYSDSPFFVLDAPWVKPEQAAGAREFQKFLAGELTPRVAAQSGFRPADVHAKPVAPIDAAHGADPTQPARVLGLPEPRVLSAAKKSWSEDRKPANVLLVLDISGSMGEEGRLEHAKDGLKVFLRVVGRQDRVGLLAFNDQLLPLVDIQPFGQGRAELQSKINDLIAAGQTAFYDAAVKGVEDVRDLNDSERINAVVLLTDGEDTSSSNSFQEALDALRGQSDAANHVRLFTIAYDPGTADFKDQLDKLAAATGGKGYQGSTSDIESVYRSISSFF
jgi:Ca-activated chloride channel homolog